LLLTGDLEAIGQEEFLSQPPIAIDAFLAPHHGGRTANTLQLYDWAKPQVVLVSQRAPASGNRDALAALAERNLPVLRTWQRGALRLRWTPTGIKVHGFLDTAGHAVSRAPAFGSLRVLAQFSPYVSRLVIVVLGIVIGGVACVVLLIIEFGAWAMIRPGRRPAQGAGELSDWDVLEARAGDGTQLIASWRGAENSGGRTAILLHGFAEEHTSLLDRAEALHRHGWNLIVPDARGRGRSGGEWTTFGAREAHDLQDWIAALIDRVGPELTVVAWGRSMGAAVALRAAADDPRIFALVLEAPYPDLRMTVAARLRQLRVPQIFAGVILRRAGRLAGVSLIQPRPVELAPQVRVPVMIVHGSEDPIVPTHAVRRLADAFPSPPIVVEVPQARHTDVIDVGGAPVIEQIARFLDDAARTTLDRYKSTPT
jgi:competence protein ComEC